jgi:hypothetical protein
LSTRKAPRSAWKPGQSGNPKGCPKGSRHKTTLAVEALLDGQAEKLTEKAIERALKGDDVALKLCLDRICPPRKDRPIKFELPESLITARDVSEALSGVIAQTAKGDITPDEATNVTALLEAKRRAIETCELEGRLIAIELRLGNGK